ncbi:MAG: hypothetical protein QM779_11855 [Propionicimonas sp.]|uniref:hypothetical protein n=1 Tax=Propionicimonas sp. TaxID=1955623 RepID=UPI003D13D481
MPEHTTTQRVVITCPSGHALGRVLAGRGGVDLVCAQAGAGRVAAGSPARVGVAAELMADDPWLSLGDALALAGNVAGVVEAGDSLKLLQGLRIEAGQVRGKCRRCDRDWSAAARGLAGLLATLGTYGPASARVPITGLRDANRRALTRLGDPEPMARRARYDRLAEQLGITTR